MMFGTVMADPKYCKTFLETILETKIKKIEYPENQKTIALSLHAKSIRMDVYIEDDKHTIYDVEIFVNAKGHKGKVSDAFQSLMHYIADGEAKDPYTQTLEKKVSLINSNDEWKVSYMTWAMKLTDERWEGREEGCKEGNISALYDLYRDGDITLQRAAVKAGMSETDFLEAAKKILEI